MQQTKTPEHPPPQIAGYDDKTLEMTRQILRLSMSDNDMARAARATAYALLLLGRLIYYYGDPKTPLPDTIPDGEEEFVKGLLADAESEILKRTAGKPMQLIVQKLVQEAQANRQRRRASRGPRGELHVVGANIKKKKKHGSRKRQQNRSKR